MDVASYIDHTVLKPETTQDQVDKLCQEAMDNHFAAVCVPPIYVESAAKLLHKSDVKVATVIGFPFGYSHTSSKIEEIKKALESGALECDVVINIAKVKNKDWDYVRNEIDSVSTAVHKKNRAVIKLILETAYLDQEELKELCNLCIKYNVDYAKTSTGYAPSGADLETVKSMKEYLDGKVMIKASGGIKTAAFAKELISAGADRLGTSSGLKLIK